MVQCAATVEAAQGKLCNTATKRPTAIFGSQNVSQVSSSKIRVSTTGFRFCMVHLPSLSSGQNTKGTRLGLILSCFAKSYCFMCQMAPSLKCQQGKPSDIILVPLGWSMSSLIANRNTRRVRRIVSNIIQLRLRQKTVCRDNCLIQMNVCNETCHSLRNLDKADTMNILKSIRCSNDITKLLPIT